MYRVTKVHSENDNLVVKIALHLELAVVDQAELKNMLVMQRSQRSPLLKFVPSSKLPCGQRKI